MNEMKFQRTVIELKLGELGTISNIEDKKLLQKLLSMGIMVGQTVQMVRKTIFGNAFYVRINKEFIALRRSEAEKINIEL
jgi:Fe2+ transport system protein FeoA